MNDEAYKNLQELAELRDQARDRVSKLLEKLNLGFMNDDAPIAATALTAAARAFEVADQAMGRAHSLLLVRDKQLGQAKRVLRALEEAKKELEERYREYADLDELYQKEVESTRAMTGALKKLWCEKEELRQRIHNFSMAPGTDVPRPLRREELDEIAGRVPSIEELLRVYRVEPEEEPEHPKAQALSEEEVAELMKREL